MAVSESLNVHTIWVSSCHWPMLEIIQKTTFSMVISLTGKLCLAAGEGANLLLSVKMEAFKKIK